MARDRDLRRGAHRVRFRPDDAPGAAPGLQPGAQRDDSAHVLPRRHRRALVRGQRPAARLGVPPGGVGALPVRASRGGAAVRALRRALGARHRLAGTYILFHLVLKEPLIALLSPRLSTFACRGFPARSWKAVVLSLLDGIVTHFLWDLLTHSDTPRQGVNWLQHASTVAGTVILAWWIWRKLRPIAAQAARLSRSARVGAFVVFVGVGLLWALGSADISPVLDLAAV